MFLAPTYIWYLDFSQGAVLDVQIPQGWSAQLQLNDRTIFSPNGVQFELGNALHAQQIPCPDATLRLLLTSETGKQSVIHLTTIVFQSKFISTPLQMVEDALQWHVDTNNYIGQPFSECTISYQSLNGMETVLTCGMENCTLPTPLVLGKYEFTVSVIRKGLFKTSTERLYCGTFTYGHPHAFRFYGKELHLSHAKYWGNTIRSYKRLELRQGCAIIENLTYIEESVPDGESIAFPCYRGTLCFETLSGRRVPFHAIAIDEYEEINPVQVWVINEYLLIVLSATGDALYIENQEKIIMNKSPDKVMSRKAQALRLETPDYFEYMCNEVRK